MIIKLGIWYVPEFRYPSGKVRESRWDMNITYEVKGKVRSKRVPNIDPKPWLELAEG